MTLELNSNDLIYSNNVNRVIGGFGHKLAIHYRDTIASEVPTFLLNIFNHTGQSRYGPFADYALGMRVDSPFDTVCVLLVWTMPQAKTGTRACPQGISQVTAKTDSMISLCKPDEVIRIRIIHIIGRL